METIGLFSFLNIYFGFFSREKKIYIDFSHLPENVTDYISTLQNANHLYSEEVQALKTQLNNLTAVVDFADSTKIAEIADLKQRHQQELDTINILMEGRCDEEFDESNVGCFFF